MSAFILGSWGVAARSSELVGCIVGLLVLAGSKDENQVVGIPVYIVRYSNRR